MRKLVLVISISVLMLLNACSKEIKNDKAAIPEILQIESVSDQSLLLVLKSNIDLYKKSIKLINQSINLDDLDLSKSYKSKQKGQDGEAIAILLNSNNSSVSYTFMLTMKSNQIGLPILVSTENSNSIKFYDLVGDNVLDIAIKNGNFSYAKSNYGSAPSQLQTEGCGQATQDCLTDAYSNHGWASLYISIQSAFIPQTAVAIAAACAAKNCL